MGYSLCKMLSLGEKLKFSRKNIKVVMCKKQLKKNESVKNGKFSKIGKIGHNARAIAFEKCSV